MPRALEGPELAAYDHVPTELARRVRIVEVPWLPGSARGLTLGRFVLLTDDVDRVGRSTLLAHELVHVEQYARFGVLGFLGRYVAEYLRLRVRGLDHRDAYLDLAMEREARQGAKAWIKLGKPDTPGR